MFQVCKDLTSKFLSVALHNNKATSPKKLKEWIDYMEHQTEMTVKEIRTDNASEYTSAKFKAWCKEKRINHQTSAPYKQNQNGVAKNAVHQLKTMAQVMLLQVNLSISYWGNAVLYTAQILNTTPRTEQTVVEEVMKERRRRERERLINLSTCGCVIQLYLWENTQFIEIREFGWGFLMLTS